MVTPKPEKLTRREREIMDALFAAPEGASAEEVRARLTESAQLLRGPDDARQAGEKGLRAAPRRRIA